MDNERDTIQSVREKEKIAVEGVDAKLPGAAAASVVLTLSIGSRRRQPL